MNQVRIQNASQTQHINLYKAGDAFYFGPERMSSRYENDEKARLDSGFAGATYKSIFDRIEREGDEVRAALYF